MTNQTPAPSDERRGQNILEEAKKTTPLGTFFRQLGDPLIYILFAAAAISTMLGELGDTAIILVVILVNATIGVIQEGKAQRALDALRELTSPMALIDRNGIPVEIPARDLMVGDKVYLDAGRQVPADLKLTSSVSLKIEESALTGESLPVEKNTGTENKAYMSTNVTYGKGEGIVTAIGMDTEIGKIARMINNAPSQMTPLQKRLGDLGKILSVISVFLCVLLFLIALMQNRDVMEMLITAISLAVAAVPEGLPAVVTLVLALSISRMVKVNTIVKRLPSVETLGSVSVVCSDKTGTLTQNKMSVTLCYSNGELLDAAALNRGREEHFLNGFLLCNDAISSPETRLGDPTELALLDLGERYRLSQNDLTQKLPRICEISFSSERKMMTTLHQNGSSTVSYTKGSPDDILDRSSQILLKGKILPLTAEHRTEIRRVLDKMTSQALRVLALSMRTGDHTPQEKDMIFLGLAGMKDPIRPEASQAVRDFKAAGVRTVMITGDRIDTALAIAKELGIASEIHQCMTGSDLQKMSAPELAAAAPRINVYAHVSPEHKMRIVEALRSTGKIVAMTGDGVNDAPSLKTADVGIAMGITGTDVAKNAADIVLADDNFATIAKAIAEGRSIYENIKKSVLFLLSSNFGEIITMLFAVILGLASPLKPSHILWINLITDSLPALALGIDSGRPDHFMKRPPRPKNESLFAEGGLSCTLLYGCLIAFISTTAFLQLPISILLAEHTGISLHSLQLLLEDGALLARSQTYAFTVLGMSQLFHAVGMRDVETSVFRMNHFSNRLMVFAFFFGILLQLLVTEIPYFIQIFGTCHLTWLEWGQMIFLAAMPLFVHEILILFSGKRSSVSGA